MDRLSPSTILVGVVCFGFVYRLKFCERQWVLHYRHHVPSTTRMHSSRMRTARGSSRPYRGLRGLPQCMLGYTHPPTPRCGPGNLSLDVGLEIPPGVGLETPLGVGLETPLGVGLETPPGQTPQLPPGCGPGDPPRPAARHAGIPPARHAGYYPPPPEQNDRCKNITLPQTSFAGGNKYCSEWVQHTCRIFMSVVEVFRVCLVRGLRVKWGYLKCHLLENANFSHIWKYHTVLL